MSNPLIDMQGLPPFSQLAPEHVIPAIQQVIAENHQNADELLKNVEHYTWNNAITPLNEFKDRLDRTWSPIEHLHNVADTEALRPVYKEALQLVTAYRNEIKQDKRLYKIYQTIANSAEYEQLDDAQQKIIQDALRDFRLSGIDLDADKQARFMEIQNQLSALFTKFSEHVLDSTKAWQKQVFDKSLLVGLSDTVLELLAQNATQANMEGWLLTLDAPCYLPIMRYASNRELRREMYEAYVTRASSQGPHAGQRDNASVIAEILVLRHELSNLVGFDNYAEYSVYTKMAESADQVMQFLNDLSAKTKLMAKKEAEELKAFAKTRDGLEDLALWDVPYYSEKLREHQYAISQEILRPYFPLSKVLPGLFAITQKLYGITVQAQTNIDVWHPEVQFFSIYDEVGELRGQFYLDLYARQSKRGGAWMDECINRKRSKQSLRVPVAYLVCNFTPPIGEKPALLTHEEIRTLFHEFGHGLHHMLTKIEHPPVAGINGVAWDAVELPSQFMENWCWEKEALDLFSAHYETGELLPQDLFDKLYAAKNFQAGLFMARQLEFALFDFRLHKEYTPDIDVQALINEVRTQVTALKPPEFNRFQNSFSHIFAGGYAAGYYSYKWAEVLSADAFEKFEENGIFDRQTGQAFMQNILEKGGSQEPMVLFVAFRGRGPKIDALLRRCGIAA